MGVDDDATDINEFRELLAACDDEFAKACRFGDVGRVRGMLRVRCASVGRVPPLCYAARNVHLGVVRALVAARATVDAQCFDVPRPPGPLGPLGAPLGRTPLFYACAEAGIEAAIASIGGEVTVSAKSVGELR